MAKNEHKLAWNDNDVGRLEPEATVIIAQYHYVWQPLLTLEPSFLKFYG